MMLDYSSNHKGPPQEKERAEKRNQKGSHMRHTIVTIASFEGRRKGP